MRKTTIYVPSSRRNDPDVRDLISTLRWQAGGMTETQSTGSWVSNGEVITEPVCLVSYLIDANQATRFAVFNVTVERLAIHLKALGEESVLLEYADVVTSFV